MTEHSEEAAAKAELRSIVEDLEGIRGRLVDLHARLPAPPNEAAMPAGEEELDAGSEARSVIECVLSDRIEPAILDLAAAVSYQPKKMGAAA